MNIVTDLIFTLTQLTRFVLLLLTSSSCITFVEVLEVNQIKYHIIVIVVAVVVIVVTFRLFKFKNGLVIS